MSGMSLVLVRPEIALEEVPVILDEHPEQDCDAVGGESVEVLEAVLPVAKKRWLCGAT